MSITYTYKIISVDEAARCMEVVYSAEGHQTMHIGARLPFKGEALEDVIQMFAPVAYWRDQKLTVVVPAIGVSGVLAEANPKASVLPSANDQFEQIFATASNGSINTIVFE